MSGDHEVGGEVMTLRRQELTRETSGEVGLGMVAKATPRGSQPWLPPLAGADILPVVSAYTCEALALRLVCKGSE